MESHFALPSECTIGCGDASQKAWEAKEDFLGQRV